MPPAPDHSIPHAVCQGCGCLCDDVEIDVASSSICGIRNVCELGLAWYGSQTAPRSDSSDSESIRRAAKLLASARFPIILGIERLTSESQRQVVRFAEFVGAAVASVESTAIRARQEVGEVTCTLGELKNRADLVVFWFCDPVQTHPRHLERYSADCNGRFIPNGRDGRSLITVDQAPTATGDVSDRFLRIAADDEFAAIQKLRLHVAKSDLGKAAVERAGGRSELESLAERMKEVKYGALVFDPSRYRSSVPVESLFELIRDLNSHTAFVAAPLGGGDNAKGAETVLQWLTGFPANVAFEKGVPRYDADAWSADALCRRGRPDVALLIGSIEELELSTTAAEHLRRIPVVQIGGAPADGAIHLPAASMLETDGTVFRMDNVPLPSQRILPASGPAPETILAELLAEVRLLNGEPASAI